MMYLQNDGLTWLIEEAQAIGGDDVYGISHKVLGINFAAIHTSTNVRVIGHRQTIVLLLTVLTYFSRAYNMLFITLPLAQNIRRFSEKRLSPS